MKRSLWNVDDYESEIGAEPLILAVLQVYRQGILADIVRRSYQFVDI